VFQILLSKVLNFVTMKTDAEFSSETSVTVCLSMLRHYKEGLCHN
jgi:hypothetical protein